MKKIRKLISALLAVSLVFSLLAVTASAAGAGEAGMQPFNLQSLADQDLETASPEMKEAILLARRLKESGDWFSDEAEEGVFSMKDLAAMDSKTAPPELKNAIMMARRIIVYGPQGWTVGGSVGVLDKETGAVTKLPEFSELWPEWDLYEISNLSVDPMYYTDTFWARSSSVEYPVKLHVLTEKERPGFDYEWKYYANSKSSAYLSKNNPTGTNGVSCASFTARRTSAVFLLTSAPGAEDYNIQLYRGPLGEGERVSDYTKVAVNNGVYFLGLTVGESYYVKISSSTLKTDGCTAIYSLFY